MKKLLVAVSVLVLMVSIATISMANSTKLDGQVAQMKEQTQQEIDDYTEKYGSESYGFTAFVLKKVQIYSIPFCFLGIAISAIYQYIIGIRRLDTRDKGFYSLVGFVTIFVICQVLPLVFAIVVRGWRG